MHIRADRARAPQVNGGLSWQSASAVNDECMLSQTAKSNLQGGLNGFWAQARSNRCILATEVNSNLHLDSKKRMFRVHRPTLHTSKKPQYIRGANLLQRYSPLRDLALAERLWNAEYEETATSRTQQVGRPLLPCALAARCPTGVRLLWHRLPGTNCLEPPAPPPPARFGRPPYRPL